MKVKWHGQMSSERNLNGGGPQGSTFGLWEYLSQSNDNAQCVDEEDRFKFVDDLSFLEVIYLLNTICAIKHATHNEGIMGNTLNTQSQLNSINDWTNKQKIKLNVK